MKPYQVKAKGKKAEIWIYQEIGGYWGEGVTAKQFAEDLKALGALDEINLRLNSPGGDVFEGIAIYNILMQNPARVTVDIDGLAASIASVIAMAGDEIRIADNAMMMVHPAWGFAMGNAVEMRKTADMLDKVDTSITTTYVKRTKKSQEEIRALMEDETWMTAKEALDYGFVDKITEALELAASFDLAKFKYRKVELAHRGAAALGYTRRDPVKLDQPTNHPGVSGQTQNKDDMKTIAEQIASFEAKRAANTARMTEIMNKSGEEGRTLDAAEMQEYDGLQADVKTVDEHLVRLHAHQKQVVATAAPITASVGTDPVAASAARGGVITVVGNNLPKGTAFTRYAIALAKSRGNLPQAAEIAKQWKDSTPEVQKVLNVAVAEGTTTGDGWASELADYTYMASEFIEFLRPMTIIGRIPGLRRVPFNIKMPLQDSGSSVGWVGEGQAKPVSKLHFDTATLRFAKAAGIVVLTDELVRFSNPSAEAIVRNDLAKAIAQFLDGQFIDPSIAANGTTSPASATYGAGNSAASGVDAEDFRTDFKSLLTPFLAANLAPTPADSAFIMRPIQALAFSLMRNNLGQKEFPDITANGGLLEGYPVVPSNSAPVGDISFLMASEIMLADDGGINLDSSREASLVMDDGESPFSTTMVSLWQNNMIALRVERIINWVRRRDAAAYYLTDCNYGGGVLETT